MSELYLILHKVRGEPAFDIAQKMMVGNEEGWVIPTSGHRAYPSDYFPLTWVRDADGEEVLSHMEKPGDTTPDHYDSHRDDNSYMEDEARTILLRKGLLKSKPVNNYRRR